MNPCEAASVKTPAAPMLQTDASPRRFQAAAATSSMFLYAQDNSIICCHHDTLEIERNFSIHKEKVLLIDVDTQSNVGSGRLVASYDAGQVAIVWDITTGAEIARFTSFEPLTCLAWMKNGTVVFGNNQGNVIHFEPSTSEHTSCRTMDQVPITALAPAADLRRFAIGFQNGSLFIASLQPQFTVLHTLNSPVPPSPIISLQWHASSPRQRLDMLAVQSSSGDLRVWSITKLTTSKQDAKVVRVLKKQGGTMLQTGPHWMAWSKNGRIIEHNKGRTLSWDVRTKHVTYDEIPTLEHVNGMAVHGPGATLFTLGDSHSVQQFDLNTPSSMVCSAHHPPNMLPSSPPVSLEEQADATTMVVSESDSMSAPMRSSGSDDGVLSPLQRLTRHADGTVPFSDSSDHDMVSQSEDSTISRTQRAPTSTISKSRTENTYISVGSSLKSGRPTGQSLARREKEIAKPPRMSTLAPPSIASLSSLSLTSSVSRHHNYRKQQRSRFEPPEEDECQMPIDLFQFTRSRLSDIPYQVPTSVSTKQLTNDDLRRQMLSTIFGWKHEMDELVRQEMSQHARNSPTRVMLARWTGSDLSMDAILMDSGTMTATDWMLLALSGIDEHSRHIKLGRMYIRRLLEHEDVHTAATLMIALGDYNDAVEIYVSYKQYMEALIVTCLFFPRAWERQAEIIKKWGKWAVQNGQQQLAIRCLACTNTTSTEPWSATPPPAHIAFESMDSACPSNSTGPAELKSYPVASTSHVQRLQRAAGKGPILKLITNFEVTKSGDGGKNERHSPLSAYVTPIAASAVGDDPITALLKPGVQSTMNTPVSARPHKAIPTIGGASTDLRQVSIEEVDTPENDKPVKKSSQQQAHVALVNTDKQPIKPSMQEVHRRNISLEVSSSPSPQVVQVMLLKSQQSSRNETQSRLTSGFDARQHAHDSEAHVVPSSSPQNQRFHWPKRRGPGSVTTSSSVTSVSSVARHRNPSNDDHGGTSTPIASQKSLFPGESTFRSRSRSDGAPSVVMLQRSNKPELHGSEDEEDYQRAVEDKERFRARCSRGSSRNDADTSSRNDSEGNKVPETISTNSAQKESTEVENLLVGEVGEPARTDESQRKKCAAQELEERRMSLARHPSAPTIPHPQSLVPPMNKLGAGSDNSFTLSNVVPPRSRTTQSERTNQGPVIGLPANPRAMRLMFESKPNLINNHPKPPPRLGLTVMTQSKPPATSTEQPPSHETNTSGHQRGNSRGSIPSPGSTGGRTINQQEHRRPSGGGVSNTTSTNRAGGGGGGGGGGGTSGSVRTKEEEAAPTLLPSTVYAPPTRDLLPRSLSAPPVQQPPQRLQQRAIINAGAYGASRFAGLGPMQSRCNTSNSERNTSRGIDGPSSSLQHSRQPPRDRSCSPSLPSPPPRLDELQHLAALHPPPPPPPPPPPVGATIIKPLVYGGNVKVDSSGGDDHDGDISRWPSPTFAGPRCGSGGRASFAPFAAAACSTAESAPGQSQGLVAGTGRSGGHFRGRSVTDVGATPPLPASQSLASKISRATERLRYSRQRPSPEGSAPAPYESVVI